MHDLTKFQRDCLYVIAGSDEQHGLAIRDELEAYYQRDINPGRLYPNLDTLVEKGLVRKASLDGRTNDYALTDRGVGAIDARREWENQYLRRTDLYDG